MRNDDVKIQKLTTPTSFWLFVGLFLIWNLSGVFHYLTSVNATVESLVAQGMSIEQAKIFHNTPGYHYAVFALGVWSGLLGAVLLLLRKAWTIPVFWFSVAMVIVSFALDAILGNLPILGLGYLGIMSFTLMFSFFELWYCIRIRARGILQ